MELLSGNEAFARGAFEAGVRLASGYPGTPSTEILENLVKHKEEVYCEWAPNEKVAFEVAAGACLTGARAICTMKHVGLNVAADPLMTLAYLGTVGGFVALVADDPGMHSSQNEQDTRQYARFAKVPLLEPSDSQEALDFVKLGLELSEKFTTPVIVRSTTRVSHSRSLVETGERLVPDRPVGFVKDPPRFVPIPMWAREMRVRLESRLAALEEAACNSPLNRIEWAGKRLGVIASGIAYQYAKEAFPKASFLKLGWSWPFPDRLLYDFASQVEEVLVVEELDDFLEEHLRSLGIACHGRDVLSGIGELSTERLLEARAKLEGGQFSLPAPVAEAADLPARPPALCPGCPHRPVFHALGKHDVVVTGDIGCYTLGVLPPLSRLDTTLCMGAGISMAHGMEKAGEPKPVVGIVGDSTFFHSGITGLLDIGYNHGKCTIFVLDNRTTAMTGHQEHPGTGLTLMGEATSAASIADFGRACGIKRVVTVNPYNLKHLTEVVAEELAADEASLIITEGACPLRERKRVGIQRYIDPEVCKKCGACLRIGCPAIESTEAGGAPSINLLLCSGCGLCAQVCKFDAIKLAGEPVE